jgi:hypothetical protein
LIVQCVETFIRRLEECVNMVNGTIVDVHLLRLV